MVVLLLSCLLAARAGPRYLCVPGLTEARLRLTSALRPSGPVLLPHHSLAHLPLLAHPSTMRTPAFLLAIVLVAISHVSAAASAAPRCRKLALRQEWRTLAPEHQEAWLAGVKVRSLP